MNKTIENVLKLVNYTKNKQHMKIHSVSYFTEVILGLPMKYVIDSKTIFIPEILIWDDYYTNKINEYTYSFSKNFISIQSINDNFLWWGYDLKINARYFSDNRVILRYKDDFIIIDYGFSVLDIILLPKNNITDLYEKEKENSIIKITEEQYLSFRSFINDLKMVMKERHIPKQIILKITDENIDKISDNIYTNLKECEYTYTDNSISLTFIGSFEKCIFTFECENKNYVTAIKLLLDV